MVLVYDTLNSLLDCLFSVVDRHVHMNKCVLVEICRHRCIYGWCALDEPPVHTEVCPLEKRKRRAKEADCKMFTLQLKWVYCDCKNGLFCNSVLSYLRRLLVKIAGIDSFISLGPMTRMLASWCWIKHQILIADLALNQLLVNTARFSVDFYGITFTGDQFNFLELAGHFMGNGFGNSQVVHGWNNLWKRCQCHPEETFYLDSHPNESE